MLSITQAESTEQITEAKALFREYEDWLGVSLCFQGFEEELAALPGEYARPEGRLLLAYYDNELAGCVAFRRFDKDTCEIKRLFVREQSQGHGLGRVLLERLIDEARIAGYKKIRLDSWIPRMGKAIAMYRSHGFYEIEPYNENPYEMIFMELAL